MQQELITPELAKQITEYETKLNAWQTERTVEVHGAVYATIVAVPMWLVSYLMSAATGPVNQAMWFSWATFFSFVGALVATAVALGLGGVMVTKVKPTRPVVQQPLTTIGGD